MPRLGSRRKVYISVDGIKFKRYYGTSNLEKEKRKELILFESN